MRALERPPRGPPARRAAARASRMRAPTTRAPRRAPARGSPRASSRADRRRDGHQPRRFPRALRGQPQVPAVRVPGQLDRRAQRGLGLDELRLAPLTAAFADGDAARLVVAGPFALWRRAEADVQRQAAGRPLARVVEVELDLDALAGDRVHAT